MADKTPYGPELFVPFCGGDRQEFPISTGTQEGVHVVLEDLSLPIYFDTREKIGFNIGAFGGFAASNGYDVVYVKDNPEDYAANVELHAPDREYKHSDTLFVPSANGRVLAMYFNGLTASRFINFNAPDPRNPVAYTILLNFAFKRALLERNAMVREKLGPTVAKALKIKNTQFFRHTS